MTQLRCRLQSLALAMLGRRPTSPNKDEVVGWVTVPVVSPKTLIFMRTLFPCSHWMHTAKTIADKMHEWEVTNSTLLYQLTDMTAKGLNSALQWLTVRGCEFVEGSTSTAPPVLRHGDGTCAASSDQKNARKKKKRKKNKHGG